MTDHASVDLHLTAIRKALADGNAAVMVGSGFSRNADGGDQLATWPKLAELIWQELNPSSDSKGSYSATQITQLGEQYAHVFSPPALENLLKREIPDDKVSPGDLHDQLLDLPWSDIFTTNYDTLLERAAEKSIERAHYTVSSREDIPQSKVLNRRRIVKLHGSFPSQRPFIFTEEDYRRYPENFAPFVNMVRQSLLENVFCLVGFSGEDPNFLHWIGWIRDMLDKHALPIYLFLDKEPPLGQWRLLEARRITVVVLPIDEDYDLIDYRARYSKLFQILARPLKPSDADWTDSFHLPDEFRTSFTEDVQEKINRLLSVLPVLRDFRASYPGWLIAPETVRRGLRRRLQGLPISLDAKIVYTRDTSKLISIVLLDQYAWHQDVLLQCFDDALAELAIRLIRETGNFSDNAMFEEDRDILSEVGVKSLKDFHTSWRNVSLALVRWARQELHEETFEELKLLLRQSFPFDLDLEDDLTYETILFKLYNGKRDAARRDLLDWNVRSNDAYMGIRKGSLLAEVGESIVGLSISVEALQVLRRRQKLRPDSTRHLSEEAWANYIVQRQHDAIAAFSFNQSSPVNPEDERISRRSADLAAKGFNVQAEIRAIAVDLDAEAQPPSTPYVMQQHFDLGHYSPSYMIGHSFALEKKVTAAFGWLSLADRVGLAPRMNRVSFDIDSYTQAAWWLQHFDSPRRVLSIAIRTLNLSVLDPKDDTKPSHMSGWLSRFWVAKTEESLAILICQHSLDTIESDFSDALPDFERSAEFHFEVFSRFVVRITDVALVRMFTDRIIKLHEGTRLATVKNLWKGAALALRRCFDALPYTIQNEFALRILGIAAPAVVHPNKDYASHYSSQWLSLHNLYRPENCRCDDEVILREAELIGARLVEALHNVGTSGELGDSTIARTWEHLVWLDHLGLLSQSIQAAVGQKLWEDADKWPEIPKFFFPETTGRWPVPHGIDADALLRKWVLAQNLVNFSTTIEPITPSGLVRKGWKHGVRDHLLQTWKYSLERHSWSPEDMAQGLRIIKIWWDTEWSPIEQNIDRIEFLRSMVIDRLDELDAVLSIGLPSSWEDVGQIDDDLLIWLNEVLRSGRKYGAMFWRLRKRDSLRRNDTSELVDIQQEMTTDLLNVTSLDSAQGAATVFQDWVVHEISNYRPVLLLEALAGIVSSRRMPNLVWALHLFSKIIQFKAQWLSASTVSMIEVGLSALLKELSYKDRIQGTGISDYDVPLLRFNAARVAFALSSTSEYKNSETWDHWLQQACDDPLPEMRYLRERWIGPAASECA